jgi:hypothetical protein
MLEAAPAGGKDGDPSLSGAPPPRGTGATAERFFKTIGMQEHAYVLYTWAMVRFRCGVGHVSPPIQSIPKVEEEEWINWHSICHCICTIYISIDQS